MSDTTPSILDIIDHGIAQKNAQRPDAVGYLVHCVLSAANPDGVMQDLARELIHGFGMDTRKLKITMLATALGASRPKLKKYLRAYSLCGEKD